MQNYVGCVKSDYIYLSKIVIDTYLKHQCVKKIDTFNEAVLATN